MNFINTTQQELWMALYTRYTEGPVMFQRK